jgi:hypothetical protein
VVAGLALLWVWQRFSNRERVALAKRQMRARLYAIRLYADEPAMVLRAQGELLIWTGRYLAQMLRPMAIASVPLLVLSVQLDNIYGHRPPAPGESAIVTAQFGGGTDVRALGATLEGRGVVVETPGVRIPSRRQVCWRGAGDSQAEGGATRQRAAACGRSGDFASYPVRARVVGAAAAD